MALTMTCIVVFGAFFAISCVTASGSSCPAEDVAAQNLRKLAKANNELAFNLYRRLVSGTSENVFISPLSISTALGMLFYGTRGETAEQLRKALGYQKAKLPNDFVHDTFNRYFSDVLKSGDSSNGYVLNSANAILADESVQLSEKYWRNVQVLYRATARNVDFSKEGTKIVNEINDWVKEKTNGKIEKLCEELSPATILVLLNTVYFKGAWENRFDPKKTHNDLFYNNGLRPKSVAMMQAEMDVPMAYFDQFKAVELPYKGGNVGMLILLPNKLDGLQALEDSITPRKLEKIQDRMYHSKVEILLPRFKLEFEKELSKPLQSLGANGIFRAGADFSGMTPSGAVSVSEVLHKAVIEVNEEGSEAAAMTGIFMFKSATIPFIVDHPFLFAIVEKGSKSNMVLFLGRVNNL